MSIVNSVANCKKPIGSGADRNVYYSKKYDCVIKVDKKNPSYAGKGEQSKNELSIFSKMTDEEREFFPMTGFLRHKKKNVVLMKKCIRLKDYISNPNDSSLRYENISYISYKEFRGLCKQDNIPMKKIKEFYDFIEKYDLRDCHFHNLGIYKGHLCVLDAGG